MTKPLYVLNRRVGWTLSMGILWLFASGCGSGQHSSEYASVAGSSSTSSLNGLGVFLKLCQQAGSRSVVTHRLSSRLDKVDAIILIGDTFQPPAKEARDWLEDWLAAQPGRTVLYFGRDFNANIYYRESTLESIPAVDRPRAKVQLSAAKAERDQLLLEELPDDVFCRWFNVEIHNRDRQIAEMRGDWSDAVKSDKASWPVRVLLTPPRTSDVDPRPDWIPPLESEETDSVTPIITNPTPTIEESLPTTYRSVWIADDIGDEETWNEEWAKVPNTEILLAGSDGTPLVSRLTHDRYAASQILVAANAAPFLNGSIVQPHFRAVAHKIIDAMQPAKRIALLPFDRQGIMISEFEDENEVAGLSVLTTWPMNMVVAHLSLLGILICLALFPILGRPQSPKQSSMSDFGQHAEATGRMLLQTGDTAFASQTIAQYYRTVRGETPPLWLESFEVTTSPTPATPSASDIPATGPPEGGLTASGNSFDTSA